MSQTFTLRVEGLKDFQRALKRLSPEAHKEFRREARGFLGPVAGDAKSRAGWSDRIPGAISVSVTSKALGIRLSKKKAPHGGLFERGAAGQAGATSFRHPLFGNRGFWFSQPTKPFMEPAVRAHESAVRAGFLKAIEHARERVGLHG